MGENGFEHIFIIYVNIVGLKYSNNLIRIHEVLF